MSNYLETVQLNHCASNGDRGAVNYTKDSERIWTGQMTSCPMAFWERTSYQKNKKFRKTFHKETTKIAESALFERLENRVECLVFHRIVDIVMGSLQKRFTHWLEICPLTSLSPPFSWIPRAAYFYKRKCKSFKDAPRCLTQTYLRIQSELQRSISDG